MAEHRRSGRYLSPNASSSTADVVVLGGGPAGCATALSLVREGVERVVVVEASDYETPRVGESIPPDTRRPLSELGLLEGFLEQGHEPCYGSRSSWGDDEVGYNDFLLNPYGHGWHLDRQRFDAWLAKEVERSGVELYRRTRFVDLVSQKPAGYLVWLRSADSGFCSISTRFVVDATGSRARPARSLGAVRDVCDRLITTAGYFVVPESAGFDQLTNLEAVEYGWWYAARLPKRCIAVLLATSHALHRERAFHRVNHWLEALARTKHLLPLLERCHLARNAVAVGAAPSFVLEPMFGADWLAVGDAAASYDPISSQGIFKALLDGSTGGQAIAAHLSGQASALKDHQSRVRARFREYTRQRAYFYDQEQRWPQAFFWRERRAQSIRMLAAASPA